MQQQNGEVFTRVAELTRHARTRRAPEAFERAYLTLLLDNRIEPLASEVIAASGYSRGSFYRYYRTLPDLLDSLIDTQVRRYVELVAHAIGQNSQAPDNTTRVAQVARELLDHVDEHRLFYRALFAPDIPAIDFEEFCNRAIARFRTTERPGTSGDTNPGGALDVEGSPGCDAPTDAATFDDEFFYFGATRSFLICIRYWAEHDGTVSREQMARQIAALCASDSNAPRSIFWRTP